jgi:hypothetical protein
MADVKKLYPRNPLRGALNAPGAMTAIEALRHASKNLDAVAEFSMAAVDQKIGALEEMVATCGDPPDAEERAAFHRIANEIFTEAGAFGHHACSQAAHSLCDLVAGKPARVEAIGVHVVTMRALRREGAPRECETIIAALRKLSQG